MGSLRNRAAAHQCLAWADPGIYGTKIEGLGRWVIAENPRWTGGCGKLLTMARNERATVIGAGAWGTALAKVLADDERPVCLWTRSDQAASWMSQSRESSKLPGVRLPSCVEVTSDIQAAVKDASLVLWAVPSQTLRDTVKLARPALAPGAAMVSATKGIENDSLMLMTDVIADVLGAEAKDRCVVLSGPSFAAEVARGTPTYVVAASSNAALSEKMQNRFTTERFRVYAGTDAVGVQIGGALKNVIAIAVGASDGLRFGANTRAALITRGLAEVARMAHALGGDPVTLAGLAGMGDMVLTCTGEQSRNRTVGYELGRGKSLSVALEELGHVAEGVGTAKSAYDLGEKHGVELPICKAVYQVLHGGVSPREAVSELLGRRLRKEWG